MTGTQSDAGSKKDNEGGVRPVTFLVAVGVVSVAPRTGWCVTVAYESRAHWRSPRQHNDNDVLVSRSRRADDVTRERRREGLG